MTAGGQASVRKEGKAIYSSANLRRRTIDWNRGQTVSHKQQHVDARVANNSRNATGTSSATVTTSSAANVCCPATSKTTPPQHVPPPGYQLNHGIYEPLSDQAKMPPPQQIPLQRPVRHISSAPIPFPPWNIAPSQPTQVDPRGETRQTSSTNEPPTKKARVLSPTTDEVRRLHIASCLRYLAITGATSATPAAFVPGVVFIQTNNSTFKNHIKQIKHAN